jgi:L-threonylcarbamoyladenylate synthase
MGKTSCRISEAAELIRSGRLVAFPTETVYGLGANALDAAAVRRIFEVKGRPSTSPLIVHVDSIGMARELAREWPAAAETLARVWWPGPLTLVVPKQPQVPDIVTAGLDTVGLRMPAHPVALELIHAAGVPIAAPSANRFTGLSPTTAEHVRRSLGDAVDCILDGGATTVGIESTVLSLAGPPALLRPGMISREEIEARIGTIGLAGAVEGSHPSPGMHARHYSPRTPVILGLPLETGRGAYLWIHRAVAAERTVEMPREANEYAAALYATLHALDAEGLDWIAIEQPPDSPEWAGVRDRLSRAAAPTDLPQMNADERR